MISKNQIKLISSLTQKKFRKQHQLFIAEGEKVITEILNSTFELEHLYCTKVLFENVLPLKKSLISESDLKKISSLNTPNNCLAIFKIPVQKDLKNIGLTVVLDDIQDPGNLGTIIRLCDWFGVSQIVCSEQSVDVYNPKVVQATMGSITRLPVFYANLEVYLEKNSSTIYGTFMDGENIYKASLPSQGIVVFGNEGNGISKAVENLITHKISIPRFGALQETESLNVAVAAAIVLSEFKRNN